MSSHHKITHWRAGIQKRTFCGSPRVTHGLRMASYSKTDKGWRVQVARRGVRKSRTFSTKKAAELWAAEQERLILYGEVSAWPRKTVRNALDRYIEEVTPTKGTARTETMRLLSFTREFPELSAKQISEVTPADLAGWRDARLKTVTPGTVKREANSLRAVWTLAAREWGWCPKPTPWASVKLPADNPERERLAGWREIRRILRRCDYVTHHPPVSGLQNVALAFLVALRTTMRASEIMGLHAEDLQGSVVLVRKHKTMHLTGKPRRVPLTPQGLRLLRELAAHADARDRQALFTIKAASLDALFRKVTSALLIEDLHFHDSRATGITHLSRKVDPLTLAKISGHRDLKILLKRYYRESEDSIAQRLARPIGQRRPHPIAGSVE